METIKIQINHKEPLTLTKLSNILYDEIGEEYDLSLEDIFESGELEENSVSSILEHTAEDGKNYQTKYYNLDAILSVGYRVNSLQATQFRSQAQLKGE